MKIKVRNLYKRADFGGIGANLYSHTLSPRLPINDTQLLDFWNWKLNPATLFSNGDSNQVEQDGIVVNPEWPSVS